MHLIPLSRVRFQPWHAGIQPAYGYAPKHSHPAGLSSPQEADVPSDYGLENLAGKLKFKLVGAHVKFLVFLWKTLKSGEDLLQVDRKILNCLEVARNDDITRVVVATVRNLIP